MSILDRIRRLFGSPPDPDHPLTDEEREGVPQTTADESASLIDGFAGGADFDPDERR